MWNLQYFQEIVENIEVVRALSCSLPKEKCVLKGSFQNGCIVCFWMFHTGLICISISFALGVARKGGACCQKNRNYSPNSVADIHVKVATS